MARCGSSASFCARRVCQCTTAANAQESKVHWSYRGEDNPAKWGKVDAAYATCSVSKKQSPINIRKPKTSDLPALQFHYSAVPLNIIDNGHSIQLNYPAGSTRAPSPAASKLALQPRPAGAYQLLLRPLPIDAPTSQLGVQLAQFHVGAAGDAVGMGNQEQVQQFRPRRKRKVLGQRRGDAAIEFAF